MRRDRPQSPASVCRLPAERRRQSRAARRYRWHHGCCTPGNLPEVAKAHQSDAPPGCYRQTIALFRQIVADAMRQLRFAKRIATGNNRLHCLFRRARDFNAPGWRFSAGCSSSQSAILAIKRRPRWCAGSSRPSMSSTIQYSSGSQLACH